MGGPPERLDEEHKALWNEVRDSLPPGVAKSPHAFAFERMVRLILKDRKGTISNPEGGQLIVLFSRFGMTPTDLEKIEQEQPESSSLSQFMARAKAHGIPKPC